MGQASFCVLMVTCFFSWWVISPRVSRLPLTSISVFLYAGWALILGFWSVVLIWFFIAVSSELWVLGSHLFLCLYAPQLGHLFTTILSGMVIVPGVCCFL